MEDAAPQQKSLDELRASWPMVQALREAYTESNTPASWSKPGSRSPPQRTGEPQMNTEAVMSKLEARFDEWLAKFEEKPISMGLKVVIVVLILRWVWRSFK